jgi:hypothetical protein
MDKAAKPANAAPNLGELSNKMYSLLQDLQPEDRAKLMSSVAQLFGDAPPSTVAIPQPTGSAHAIQNPGVPQGGLNPQQYFAEKAPQNKGEMLAVAAKYREDYSRASSHTSEDLATFFAEARQNFDRRNFRRDMKNAQNQAQLFNKGTPRGQYQLSYFGQQYVDALPNRDALKKLRRPGRKVTKPPAKRSGAK